MDSKLCGWNGRWQYGCHEVVCAALAHGELCGHFQFPEQKDHWLSLLQKCTVYLKSIALEVFTKDRGTVPILKL